MSTPRFVRRNAAFFVGATERRNANDLRKRTDDRAKSPPKTASNVENGRRSTSNDKTTATARWSTSRYIFRSFSILKGRKKVFPKFSAFTRKSVGLRAPLLAKNEKKWKLNRLGAGNFSRRFVGFLNRRAPSRRNASRALPFFAFSGAVGSLRASLQTERRRRRFGRFSCRRRRGKAERANRASRKAASSETSFSTSRAKTIVTIENTKKDQ